VNSQELVARGKRVVRIERDALAEVEQRLDDRFAKAVGLIVASTGRVIVAGVGKSGLIGRKVAATLTSTGTPSTFLHPVDSVHGDLGIVGTEDVAILISKSGESAELLQLIEHIKRVGVKTIAITGSKDSTIARLADVSLDAWVKEEACSLDLAPTSSTTAALALGDALAVAVFEEKGFKREDFARLHPGGMLGRRLLTRVSEIMLTDRLPVLPPSATMREAVVQLAERRGIVIVSNGDRHVMGVVTAGDLSRLMEHNENVFSIEVASVMTKGAKVARADDLGSAVVFTMETHGIMAMPVVNDDDQLVGVVHLHDLMRAGVA
jgi:arabinose-5-phosphate isomerase